MSTTPQISAIRPLTNRIIKISLYETDLPVGGRPLNSPWWVPGNRVHLDDLAALFDQILDRNVKVGECPVEPREHHLLERLHPGCFKWGVLLHVRIEDLIDCLRDKLRITGVHGV